MPNPQTPLGFLNRLDVSVVFPNFSTLNVTPSFLNKEGVTLTLDGEATKFLPTMTGAVTSGEPYLMASVSIHLLRTQQLANVFLAQLQAQTVLGPCTVRTDSTVHNPYYLFNTAIESVEPLKLNGEDASWTVMLRAYWYSNNDLWG